MTKSTALILVCVLLSSTGFGDDGEWEVIYTFPQWFVILDVACSGPWDVWVAGLNEQTNTNQIYHSSDGGESWTMQYSGMDLAVFLVGMDAPADGSTVFIAGTFIMMMSSDGTGAMTSNSGSNWNPIPPADDFISSFRSVTALSSQEAYLVGGWGFSDIKGLYATFDGGSNWEQFCEVPASHPLQFASFAGDDIWVTGGVWPEEEERPAGYSEILTPNVRLAAEAEIGGESGSTDEEFEASIWHSGNGGSSWTEQFSSIGVGCMGGIDMIDVNTGIAVGGGPDFVSQIYRTANGGNTWSQVSFASQNDHILSDIEMVNASEGWAVGYDPNGPGGQPGTAIIGTTDGGLTWSREPINEATALLGLDMYDEHRGYTAGGNNLKISRVIRYDDGYYSQSIEGSSSATPVQISLNPPVPNPFTESIALTVNLSMEQHIHLAVYDISGQMIATITDEVLPGGTHYLQWYGTDDSGIPVQAGVYFAQCSGGSVSETTKMILLR